jgi:hypothetical protein
MLRLFVIPNMGMALEGFEVYTLIKLGGIVMATTSFDKDFKVTDEAAIKRLKSAAANPIGVVVKKRDYASDKSEGMQLLKQKLSSSAM